MTLRTDGTARCGRKQSRGRSRSGGVMSRSGGGVSSMSHEGESVVKITTRTTTAAATATTLTATSCTLLLLLLLRCKSRSDRTQLQWESLQRRWIRIIPSVLLMRCQKVERNPHFMVMMIRRIQYSMVRGNTNSLPRVFLLVDALKISIHSL